MNECFSNIIANQPPKWLKKYCKSSLFRLIFLDNIINKYEIYLNPSIIQSFIRSYPINYWLFYLKSQITNYAINTSLLRTMNFVNKYNIEVQFCSIL